MLDIKFIVENTEFIKKTLANRNVEISIIDNLLTLNNSRKEMIQQVESQRAETKKLSKEIGALKKQNQNADSLMEQVAQIKSNIEGQESQLEKILEQQNNILATLPNLPDESVPVGRDETGNVEVKRWGTIKKFDFEVQDHVSLGENLGLLDFERGAKLAGARFVVYKGALARMERALISFMLDQHTACGYQEIIPPFIVNEDCMYGTGQLPKFAEDSFKLEGRNWYLIPTAEVPVTNLKRNELFTGNELPLRYVAYTPCFRSEAGSYGKDTRGLIRLHQFNKVELVNITRADASEAAHQEIIGRAEAILEKLELPYRRVLLCTGDMGFSAKKCIDLEVWLPGQNKYREISSISNCGDFQARRAQIRYRDENNKPQFAHTLNGSGLAVGRTLVAILENYQQADGTIMVPHALRPYMNGQEVIGKK